MKTPTFLPTLVLAAMALSSGATLAGRASDTIVSIEATSPVTAEPAPNILVVPGEFTIRRRGGDLSERLSVFVAYSGTATPGKDYRELPERVDFAPGEESRALLVLGIDDDELEEDETVIARVYDPTLGPVPLFLVDPEHESATVTINDTDHFFRSQVVSIEATRPETTEPAPHIRVIPGQFTLRRRAVLGGDGIKEPLTVFLRYTGTATSGDDYESLPERVEFAAGQEALELEVRAVDDDEREETETVIATLHRPSNGGYEINPNHRSATVTIHDSDGGVDSQVVSIEATRRIAEETAAPLRRINLVGEFTVSRTGAAAHDLPVWIHVSGSATPHDDYEPLPLLVRIPAGEKSVSVPVTAVFDQEPEGIETVVATVANCPPEGLRGPCYEFAIDESNASDTVFIREDGLTVATVHLTEPTSGAHFASGTPIPISATAIHIESYISRVEFWAGDTRIGESEIFFVRAPDPGTPIHHGFAWERAPEGTHVLTARAVHFDSAGTIARIVSSPVRITVGKGGDNQHPKVAIASPSPGDHFPAGEPINIVIEARDPDGYIPQVELFADGLKIGEMNISFLIEPTPGLPQNFTFTWDHSMPGDHVLTARVTDNEGGSSESSPVLITVNPRDARPTVTVVARDALAVEPRNDAPPNPAIFRIRRHGSTTGDLTVHYSLDGRAENGVDYHRLPGTASIPDGGSWVDVTVVPLADGEAEGSESVKLRLSEDPGYLLERPRQAYAVIRDEPWPHPRGPRCFRLGDGLFHVCFTAPPGICFRLEGTSDLRNWTTIFCLRPVDGAIHFVDETAPDLPRRFFRIAPEPDGLAGDE